MSQNTNTIYNNLVVSDSSADTATTLSNTSVNFGSNLLSTPLNTVIDNNGINTPLGNIGFAEVLIIRDATQAIALPIPNDGLTLKVVDTIEIANQENPIGATKTNYGYNSITASNGLTINGSTTFLNVPKSNELPSAPTDLVNLTYLQNNPPPSAVIFYFNNSQVPTPLINTYKLLAVVENELPQSSITTTLADVGTVGLIQGFANQLINLNGASFIPSGVWDCNFWASCATAGDATHMSVYFSVFGISALGVETQIGVNSSSASIINTSISQYKTSLALSYTDISIYESLVIKLYAINSRSASTTITNYFESGSSYSHIHTSFGVYVPPNLLSLNNTWTGLNTFSQPPIMSGSNISSASILDSSLSSSVALKNANNVFTASKNTFYSNVVGSTPYLNFDNAGANLYISSARNGSPVDVPPSFTTGSFNHCIGSVCGSLITTGIENFIFGRNSLQNLITGDRNCAFGNASLSSSATDLAYNVAMGWRSGLSLQTGGINNVFIGQSAGASGGAPNVTNCTFLGSATRVNSTVTLFNKSTAIGADASITASNQIVLGTATETTNILGSLTVNGGITGTVTTALNVNLTSDNTIGTYFIPFSKTITTSNALFVDNTTGPLTYNPSTGNLNTISITSNFIQNTVQTLASGSTINIALGSIIVDAGTGASTYTLPSLTATSNGISVTIQKTSATNHNCVITAGATNQISAIGNNVPANTFTMTNNIYQQSFKFISPNWYPF